MKNPIVWVLTVACALLLQGWARAELIQGTAVKVADGDTVTLLTADNRQYKIRLAGIDAPEKKQPFGQRAKQSLADLVFGKRIDADCYTKDRYQRSVCKLLLEGRDVNLAQLERGLAWHYKRYQDTQSRADRKAYAAAKNHAKKNGIGLWSQSDPVAPWDHRRGKRQKAARQGAAPTVKLSRSGICHDAHSRWYARTKYFEPYKTLAECLSAGGRLPK